MLKIENYNKARHFLIMGTPFHIGQIDETEKQYLIHCRVKPGLPGKTLFLERTPIGAGDSALYEVWIKDGRNNMVKRKLFTAKQIGSQSDFCESLADLLN